MSRRRFVVGALAALVTLVGGEASAAPRSLAALGRRFRALRRAHDRASFDKFGSAYHELMNELGRRLGVAGTPSARVRAIMGPPDRVRDGKWIYLWRGWHDYLYFEIANDRVVRSEWYMAGE